MLIVADNTRIAQPGDWASNVDKNFGEGTQLMDRL